MKPFLPTTTDRQGSLTAVPVAVAAAFAVWAPFTSLFGASHSDAPLIKQDPQANITDVYAFVGTKYDGSGTEMLNILVSVRPFSDPGDGVIYDRFADDVRYSIHLANPTTGADVRRYDFFFSDVNPKGGAALKNSNTILSYGLGNEVGPIIDVGDARQNYTQTYNVAKAGASIGSGFLTPPPNAGLRTTPFYNDSSGRALSGATKFEELDRYTQQAIHELTSGEVVFAGPREDGFYADTPAIFDLLDGRLVDNNGNAGDGLGQDGGGVDGFKGFNVLTYALQIPVSELEGSGHFPAAGVDDDVLVGVYASTSRRRLTIRSTSRDAVSSGAWIQVSRMGNPLFNEVLVPLSMKDRYNQTRPTVDKILFAPFALEPELPVLINFVFGTSYAETDRTDLAGIFIPDVLRVKTTERVRLPGNSGFSRLSFIGGDLTSNGFSSGWPNGRRIGDDVVDIALTAVASGPAFTTITVLGDNVAANDQLYNQVFPYLGTPHAGPTVSQRVFEP